MASAASAITVYRLLLDLMVVRAMALTTLGSHHAPGEICAQHGVCTFHILIHAFPIVQQPACLRSRYLRLARLR
jgi:hypothetical protein